tara:strand:- start:3772 stop:4713 length:942 start_codon:yes stop_codon:yes gene_type:complete
MAFAQNSRSGLSYIVESTFGTTPAGDFTAIPQNTNSLNLTKDRVQGNEIQPDRMLRVDRHGNRQVGGDIVVDLRDGDLDPFLESAMFGVWDATPVAAPDVLKTGVTPKYFSIEDAANDIAQYRLFTGMAVSSLAISIAPNQMVTATFSMMGKDMTISGTGKTVVAASGAQPFDAYSGVLAIGDVASATTAAIVTSIDFTIDNGIAPTFVVGSESTPQLEFGMAAVEGTFTAYFEDASLINRFIDEVESELIVNVNDPTGNNQYTFTFPRIKINGADVPVDGATGSRVITLPFVALYDATEGSNLVISRPDTSA